MAYKNLFFDLDDTLWAFTQNARDTFEELYDKYRYDRFFHSFQHYYTLYQQHNLELWAAYGRGQLTKDELNRQRFLYPLEAVGAQEWTDAACARGARIPASTLQPVHPVQWFSGVAMPQDAFGRYRPLLQKGSPVR